MQCIQIGSQIKSDCISSLVRIFQCSNTNPREHSLYWNKEWSRYRIYDSFVELSVRIFVTKIENGGNFFHVCEPSAWWKYWGPHASFQHCLRWMGREMVVCVLQSKFLHWARFGQLVFHCFRWWCFVYFERYAYWSKFHTT